MSRETGDRMRCEICDQDVVASRLGYGPWCDLYFGERGQACLPRVLQAFKWYLEEQRPEDARLLKLWAGGHWDLNGVDFDA